MKIRIDEDEHIGSSLRDSINEIYDQARPFFRDHRISFSMGEQRGDRQGGRETRRRRRSSAVEADSLYGSTTAFTNHPSTSHNVHGQYMSGVTDVAGPSTSNPPMYQGMNHTTDYYVPQRAYPDEPVTPYFDMPPSTQPFSELLSLDVGIRPDRPQFDVSAVPYPSAYSWYHDSGEPYRTSSSDRPTFNLNIDSNSDDQPQNQSNDMPAAPAPRRGNRHRHPPTCGTGGHRIP